MAVINSPPLADDFGTTTWVNWFMQVFRICFDVTNSGTTAQRPVKFIYVGKFYFDTTLNKPIWVKTANPVVWIDATGAVV